MRSPSERTFVLASARWWATAVVFLAFHPSAAAAVFLRPGDLVVVDAGSAAVLRVDCLSGAQTLISDAGAGLDVVVAADGAIWLTRGPDLIRVDPSTGLQTVVAPDLVSGGVVSPRAIPASGTRMPPSSSIPDLKNDREEQRDRLDEYPQIAEGLRARLEAWAAGLIPPGIETESMPEIQEQYYDYYLEGEPAP